MRRDSRSPYGERGLKFIKHVDVTHASSRSPYGERGLKFRAGGLNAEISQSLSLRRAWIEMSSMRSLADIGVVALLTESVD